LQHAQTGVDEDARVLGGQQRGVAGTPARKYAEFEYVVASDPPEYTGSVPNRMGWECLGCPCNGTGASRAGLGAYPTNYSW
jgi:hypothetical protein